MTSPQRVTRGGNARNGASRQGNMTSATDWSMAITVKRYETDKREQPPASTVKSRDCRPASDEFILRAVSAKQSRQSSVSASKIRTRSKVNSSAADTTDAHKSRMQQRVMSTSNNAVDVGQSSLVIKPVLHRNGDVGHHNDSIKNTDIVKAKSPAEGHKGGTLPIGDQSQADTIGQAKRPTPPAKTLDIFLPLIKATDNDN